jgi:DNA repair exonuclease SbcCD ATPase subunit
MKAISTLESLHDTNNRQVCAISHREEVKERIPVQIQVNQASQSSASTIEIVPKMDE